MEHGQSSQRVKVAESLDGLLKSSVSDNILKARDFVQKNHLLMTPMTMFVLSARLYDVGERDESVFWFYNALFRSRAISYVLDKKVLAQVNNANNSFHSLLGSFVNGYAFCDIKKQKNKN